MNSSMVKRRVYEEELRRKRGQSNPRLKNPDRRYNDDLYNDYDDEDEDIHET